MAQRIINRKHLFVFLAVLSSVFLTFAIHKIDKSLTCNVPATTPISYFEAYERASNYSAKGQKREFLSLYLWQSDEARQCYTLALANYNYALSLEPNHADALANRASTYISLAEYDKAIDDYRAVLEINSQDHYARLGIALAYEKSDQLELAVLAYEEAINFMKSSSYWTHFHPDAIDEVQTKLDNLHEIIQQQTPSD
jgi:tetratricopeptide (TPR) repeat protein